MFKDFPEDGIHKSAWAPAPAPAPAQDDSTSATDNTSDSMSEFTTDVQKRGISFNAYGPNGERREMKKVQTTESETSVAATDNGKGKEPVKVGKSGWAKPVCLGQFPR